MEVIKRKIATLKNDLDQKDEEICQLRAELKHEKIEREKAENEASGQSRKVIKNPGFKKSVTLLSYNPCLRSR